MHAAVGGLRVLGAVLVGGAGSRMGADKATLVVDGVAMGERAVGALRGAGVDDVVLVGATDVHASLPGRPLADRWPGGGPVGGLITALGAAAADGADGVLCLATDLPDIDAASVVRLLPAGEPSDGRARVRLGTVAGRPCPPNGWWPARLLDDLGPAFDPRDRSFRDLIDRAAARVDQIEIAALADADTPDDLARRRPR